MAYRHRKEFGLITHGATTTCGPFSAHLSQMPIGMALGTLLGLKAATLTVDQPLPYSASCAKTRIVVGGPSQLLLAKPN